MQNVTLKKKKKKWARGHESLSLLLQNHHKLLSPTPDSFTDYKGQRPTACLVNGNLSVFTGRLHNAVWRTGVTSLWSVTSVPFPPRALKAFAFLKLGKMDTFFFFFFNENGSNSYPGLCNSLISFAYLYVLDISSVQSLTLIVARYSKGLQLEISFFIIKQEWTDGFWNRVCKTGPLKDMSRLEQLTVVSFPEPWGLWALALAFRGSWGKVPGPLWRA